MSKFIKLVALFVLFLSSYHLVRDILQALNYHSWFTNILHRPHLWCRPYCNVVTLPLDIICIVASFYLLKSQKSIIWIVILLSSVPLWLLAVLLP